MCGLCETFSLRGLETFVFDPCGLISEVSTCKKSKRLSIKFIVVTDWKTLTYNETRHEDTEEVFVASWRFKSYIPWRGWNVRAELWSYLDQWRGVTGFGDIQSMQKT